MAVKCGLEPDKDHGQCLVQLVMRLRQFLTSDVMDTLVRTSTSELARWIPRSAISFTIMRLVANSCSFV